MNRLHGISLILNKHHFQIKMCYSISQMKQKAYKAALREGAPQTEIDRLYNEWQESQRVDTEDDQTSPMAYLNGFEHPKLFTLVHTDQWHANRMIWGLIPPWIKNNAEAKAIQTKTLNARGETIFEKAAFKLAAIESRCLIMVDGFFEYQHKGKRSFPHFIQHAAEDKPMVFGGLWSEWCDPSSGEVKQTASIVTTRANELMSMIHNKPKIAEARMPLILHPDAYEPWLRTRNPKEIQALIQPYPAELMKAYSVKPLIGKNGSGDSIEATKPHVYADLAEQGSLF